MNDLQMYNWQIFRLSILMFFMFTGFTCFIMDFVEYQRTRHHNIFIIFVGITFFILYMILMTKLTVN